jgi:putative SOS response-associated peptidase YedK
MCGRFIAKTDRNWQNFFTLKKPPPAFESYNIAPTQRIPVVRRGQDASESEGNDCDLLRWGLIPFFAKGIAGNYSTINARVETMTSSPAYRVAWKRAQRCIIPANGFYEWQERDGGKQPWFVHLRDRELFGLAGLWDRSVTVEGEVIDSCTIVTLPASPFMAAIHNSRQREPAILRSADHELWLGSDPARAQQVLRPSAEGEMLAREVSRNVNSPRNHGSDLLRELGGAGVEEPKNDSSAQD